MNFLEFINAFLEFQLIALAILILFRRSSNKLADRLLSVLTLILALVLLPAVFTFIGILEDVRFFVNFDHYLGFAIPPTLYLYIKILFQGRIDYKWWRILHYVPVICSTAYFVQFHWLPEVEQLAYIQSLYQSVNIGAGKIAIYIYALHFLMYFIFGWKIILTYKSKITENRFFVTNINWAQAIMLHQLVIMVFLIYLTYTGNTPGKDALLVFFSSLIYYYFIYLIVKHPQSLHCDTNWTKSQPNGIKLDIHNINSHLENPLSEREFEVLVLVTQNMANAQIAQTAGISVNTVKYHLKNIYLKTGMSSRIELSKL